MNLMDLFFYVICPLTGVVFWFTAPWLLPLIWKRVIPAASRTLFWAARRKLIPILIVHDSGRGILGLINEKRGEGIVVTNRGNYRLLPRFVPIGEEVETQAEKTEEPNPEKSEKRGLLDYTTDWIMKRCFLVGLGTPFYVGYSGSLCLLNPECLAWYEANEIFVSTPDKPYPANKKEKSLPQPLMLLEPRKIKGIINRSFDTTQISAIVEDARMEGMLGRGFGRYASIIGIIMIIAVIFIVALVFAPQLMQHMGGTP